MTEEIMNGTGLSDSDLAAEAEKAAIDNLKRELPMYEEKIIEVSSDIARCEQHIAYLETMKKVMAEKGWKPLRPVYEFELDEEFIAGKAFIEDVKAWQEVNHTKNTLKSLQLQHSLIQKEITRIKDKLAEVSNDG